MKTEKLRIKDLVTIGVFTVIYFVVMFISGMAGMIPILFLANPAIAGITTGIVMMLFMAKIQKPCAMRAAASVIFLVTNVSPRRSLSWLKRMPFTANMP